MNLCKCPICGNYVDKDNKSLWNAHITNAGMSYQEEELEK